MRPIGLSAKGQKRTWCLKKRRTNLMKARRLGAAGTGQGTAAVVTRKYPNYWDGCDMLLTCSMT
jgi:hypothetical protein